MDELAVVLEFNRCIDHRDLEGLSALMGDAHRFIDAAGSEIVGKKDSLRAWTKFFEQFPDYRNIFETVVNRSGRVAIAGRSTCSDERLNGPALWTASVLDGRVSEWRVHEDTPGNRARLGLAGESDTEENKRLIRQFYEEVVSTGDVERVEEFVAPDCVENTEQGTIESGVEGMIEHVKGVREVYADLRITVERQVAEGEWVVSVITACGTHEGEWLGIRPTGRQLTFSGVNVDRVVEGRIVEHGGAANLLIPLLEAGALRRASD